MRIAICEDEMVFQQKMESFLSQYYKSIDVLIKTFNDGEELIKYLKKGRNKFDIYFMDIEMKKIDGIETCKILRDMNIDKPIILVTSHGEMAIDGYDVEAFNFLTKPINKEKLYKILDKIKLMYCQKERVCISTGDNNIILDVDDIKYIKADNVYIDIYCKNNEVTARKKIGDMEKELPNDRFYRPHKSYVINLNNIKSYNGKNILMDDGQIVPISRNKVTEFKEKMINFFNGMMI